MNVNESLRSGLRDTSVSNVLLYSHPELPSNGDHGGGCWDES